MYADYTEPPNAMETECKTKVRLELEWREAADMYNTLQASLTDKKGQCTEEEYARLRVVATTASDLADQLRRDLDEHIRNHGC
jgi:hypothetical protein